MKKKINLTLPACIILCLFLYSGCAKKQTDFTVFAGAGLIKPMEELVANFERKAGISAQVHYGSSGELFGMIGAGQYCDVLIPGADKYTKDALRNGWLRKDTIKNIVLHIPVIIVPGNNPGKIEKLEDLSKPNVKIALGDPKGPAIGRVAKKILQKAGLWEKVKKNVVVMGPTVNQLVIYPALKQVDAAIVWEDITFWAEDKDKVKTIQIAKNKNIIKTVPTAITTQTVKLKLSEEFNKYITSTEGMKIWEKWGFRPCVK